ncbi:unnamed protein product [Nippostrongylus brasiliensis]|uniref:Saposin B-type domain-containing protein n=1 Tax=Nippostrongylus brasiliensis TaxID=27835 RepID=A0A0N4Y612_NIPBR|nr:unnamed protein product [Nippostrongylus brasiliensis]
MSNSLFVALLLAAVALPQLEGKSALGGSARMDACTACTTVLDKVAQVVNGGTNITEEFLEEVVENFCSKYLQMETLQQVCVNVQDYVIEAVFTLFKKAEGAVDTKAMCTYIKVCTPQKDNELKLNFDLNEKDQNVVIPEFFVNLQL